MSEMIERVARALALADLDEGTREVVDLDAHMAHVSGHYEELARAAIEAMKNPSIEMRSAAQQSFIRTEQNQITAMWNAMIDEALRK